MKGKVLITGASGFLGFHLIQATLERGYEVFAGVRRSSNVDHLKDFPLHFVFLDFSDSESLVADLEEKKYDYIIHAAGTTKAKTLEEYNTVNADYTFNLVQCVAKSGIQIKKLVFISSLASVGPLTDLTEKITETTPQNPVTDYGRSKKLAEQKIQNSDVPIVILRPTAIYGPREKDLFILFKTIGKGFEPYIGRIGQQLSFVYAKDVAAAAINAFSCPSGSVYNLTDGHSYSRYDLANNIKSELNRKTFKVHLPYWEIRLFATASELTGKIFNKVPTINRDKLNELIARNWICDIGKAERELNFYPKYDLKLGVRETIRWYKNAGWM